MAGVLLGVPYSSRASVTDEIQSRQRQIEEYQRQIDVYQQQADQLGTQSRTLQNEIAKLNARIGQITAEVNRLRASIEQTGFEIQDTEAKISDAEKQLAGHRAQLSRYLQISNQSDQQSLAEVLIGQDALSDFFGYLHDVERTQDMLAQAIRSIQELRVSLDAHREDLEGKKGSLERMRALQEIEQRSLGSTKQQKDTVLKQTKGQETKFQKLVQETQKNIDRLREQIVYLQKSGISAEDAVKYGQLAAVGAGIRPAFLLALLETESRLGQNVGTGNWRDDMYECYLRLSNIAKTADRKAYYIKRAETEKNAFMAIIQKLGLNPDSVKVSREPSYGCGGAMGPAQFIPSTWLAYEESVSAITGNRPPNPWSVYDAFTAAAVKLARGGATSKDRTGETRAAKAYISGNAQCTQSVCNSYANTILLKAAQIEQDL